MKTQTLAQHPQCPIVTPEPNPAILVGLALALMLFALRRRTKRRS